MLRELPAIACIGECMVEMSSINEGLFSQAFAGDTLNTAIYMKRSSPAIPISYITTLGDDAFSHKMKTFFENECIDCQWVKMIEHKAPGIYSIEVDQRGERQFVYWRSDSAAKQLFINGLSDDDCKAIAQQFDVYFFSGITLAILDVQSRLALKTMIQDARKRGAKIAFDSNYRPKLWGSKAEAQAVISDFLSITDIALLTLEDEHLLFGDQSEKDTFSRLQHIDEIIIKNGSDGCFIRHVDDLFFVPALQVAEVVDTTSAGDSFNGSYLAKRMLGCSVEDAALFAHRMAASVIQYKGAIIPKEITDLLNG